MTKKITTEKGLFEYLRVTVLASSIQALAKIVDKLASENIVVEGEALETLGLAYISLTFRRLTIIFYCALPNPIAESPSTKRSWQKRNLLTQVAA